MSLRERISKIHPFDYCEEINCPDNENELLVYFGFKGDGNLHFYLSYWEDVPEYMISIWKNKELVESIKITDEFETIEMIINRIIEECV